MDLAVFVDRAAVASAAQPAAQHVHPAAVAELVVLHVPLAVAVAELVAPGVPVARCAHFGRARLVQCAVLHERAVRPAVVVEHALPVRFLRAVRVQPVFPFQVAERSLLAARRVPGAHLAL